ncbi:MAG: hypothetical protein AAF206_25135, partial [Bacteroidota bacterium]
RKYDNLVQADSKERVQIYWKCVFLFYASSIRCNPEARHVLYTNEESPEVMVGRVDLLKRLKEMGVEIHIVPFDRFKPPYSLSKKLTNCFYRLEVVKAMAEEAENEAFILLDSDVLWTRHDPQLMALLTQSNAVLYDRYEVNGHEVTDAGMSRMDMGNAFRTVDENYHPADPIHFGGEIVGGPSQVMQKLSHSLEQAYDNVISACLREMVVMPNGRNIMDTDEYVTSFAYNMADVEIGLANPFIKRLWTGEQPNNVETDDVNLTLWHLIAEKQTGLAKLYDLAIEPDSSFWQITIDDFPAYLGAFVGIPERLHDTPLQLSWKARAKKMVMKLVNG